MMLPTDPQSWLQFKPIPAESKHSGATYKITANTRDRLPDEDIHNLPAMNGSGGSVIANILFSFST